ncbi:MAG: U32 family peptidase [Lachnospiraceae bacterium]|nr:U32 family peptidase [Lachnospiraceae bacterium]
MSLFKDIKEIKKPELLAPAGNPEGFYGVLRAGADAVYLAGRRFGARAYADNFSDEELITCIKFAHFYDKKVYLTVNTLTKDDELDELLRFAEPLYKAGLDGVIVQDLGVLTALGGTFPGLALHASTQLSVTGEGAAMFLKELGVSRIVPARELSFNEIKNIKRTGVEIECFVHGAMCYSYSGACLFSSVIGGRSGNRGRCAQPCRLPYKYEGKEEYPLSLKDMQTIGILDKLIEAGIDSFKIEGRMKKPEYAAGVTAIYRKYIDKYFNEHGTNGKYAVSDKDIKKLGSLYIRSEISDGYYNRYNGRDMVTIGSPSYNGSDEGILENIRVDYLGKSPQKELPRIPIRFEGEFIEGKNCVLKAVCGEYMSEARGGFVESAQNRPISREDIVKSLKKLGNTVFSVENEEDIFLNVSDTPYYSLKEINELRREAVSKLEEIMLRAYSEKNRGEAVLPSVSFVSKEINYKEKDYKEDAPGQGLCVLVRTSGQLDAAIRNIDSVRRIYIPEEMLLSSSLILKEACRDKVFAALSFIRRVRSRSLRDKISELVLNKKIAGVLVRNLDDLYYFSDKIPAKSIICDHSLYAWNRESVKLLSGFGRNITLPLELSHTSHRELIVSSVRVNFEKVIYGRYPLMQSANCIYKTEGKCLKGGLNTGFTYLTDRTGRKNPLLVDCAHCHNTLYNSVPLSVYKLDAYKGLKVSYRLEFTNENEIATEKVLEYYKAVLRGSCTEKPSWEYTGGFEKKSTE